jgi:predicted Zn-dependent protease
MNQRSFQCRGLALLLALLVSEPAWTVTPTVAPELPDPGSVGITKEQQEQLGRQAMAEVYKQLPVLPDSSPQTRYIRQLGIRLADVIPPEYSWPFEFHVIPQKDINAFALPGGPMFVNVGAIVAAENEAELAGVMAHEMSHVYMQHSAKQASKAQRATVAGGGVPARGRLGTHRRF